MSNKSKFETLGIPYGTALNKLRKNIIFELLTGTRWMDHPGMCCRCGKFIESADDMTIEHIQPWEGRENGKELFWDLENIDFSHRECNRPHSPKGGRPLGLLHGTKNNYNKGCRCEACREDKRQKQRNWRQQRREQGLKAW